MAEQVSNQHEPQPELVGLLAEFRTPAQLVTAARRVRDEGYRRIDAFSPFPVHGLDEALAVRRSVLPWLVLGAGVAGAVAALVGQWWTNTVDYPYLVSGKPLFSLPAKIPVTFEVIILFSGFAAFFGMLALNGLPRLAQPLFRSARFRRATADRFFLLIESADAKFAVDSARQSLAAAGAAEIEELYDDASPVRLPSWVGWTLACLALLALIPPLWIARARVVKSDKPRWHTFIDMDFQPTFRPQSVSTFFVDGRADRVPVSGTVARGQLREDTRLYQGTDLDSGPSNPEAEPAANGGAEETPVAWVHEMPLPATERMMKRGQQQYNVFCAPCHGLAGEGDGLVARRAQELQQATWLPPTSLHSEAVRDQPAGQLFHAISNGVRKMPAYAAQVSVPDRWAIVLYMRALQRTQNAAPEDVPPEIWKAMKP